MPKTGVLCGVTVTRPATGPKVWGFQPSLERWIFKGKKVHSTIPLGGGVNPSAPYHKILWNVKDP
jgi:hypothetical protein